jgi:hypothetical protein
MAAATGIQDTTPTKPMTIDQLKDLPEANSTVLVAVDAQENGRTVRRYRQNKTPTIVLSLKEGDPAIMQDEHGLCWTVGWHDGQQYRQEIEPTCL